MKKIGRYQVLQEIGRGGMATVYLARDQFSGRRIAIKVLPPQFTHDPRFRSWFKREARAIAALEHAYIVPVYDFGEEQGQPFIVMRYMPGGTLADRIASQPLSLVEAVPILQRVAEGLDAAHRRGIIHRDLKPRNVLFDDDGQAFLSDFGLARFADSVTTISSLSMYGTPAYISPEQASGDRKLDSRSDVYSLGVIVYETLSGQRPFKAETPMGLMLKHVTEPMPPVDTQALGLPAEVNDILGRALAKRPEDRYPTANALAEALRDLVPESELLAAGAPRPVPLANGATQPLPLLGRLSPAFWAWGGVLGISLVSAIVGVAIFVTANGGFTPPASLTPTQAESESAPPSVTAAPLLTATEDGSETLLPSATATPTASPSATATPSPTPTASAQPSATRTRVPSTARPTSTPFVPPTVTLTPTPVCIPPEFFDPLLGRCRLPEGEPTSTLAPP